MNNITLTVRNSWMYSRRHLYAGNVFIPEMYNVTGLVIPNPPWIHSDCLTILDLKGNLLFIEKSEVCASTSPPKVKQSLLFSVKSRTKQNKSYNVSYNGDIWTCECVAYISGRECNHIIRCKTEWTTELNNN